MNHDFEVNRAQLRHLRMSARGSTATRTEIDAHLAAMHVAHHDRARDHVRVHLEWARVMFERRSYVRGLGHAFVGLVIAGPSSLLQRYTGLVAPAFDAARATSACAPVHAAPRASAAVAPSFDAARSGSTHARSGSTAVDSGSTAATSALETAVRHPANVPPFDVARTNANVAERVS